MSFAEELQQMSAAKAEAKAVSQDEWFNTQVESVRMLLRDAAAAGDVQCSAQLSYLCSRICDVLSKEGIECTYSKTNYAVFSWSPQ